MAQEIRQTLQHTLEELKTLRDEIKVRLHLAGMEAKTRWNEDLEPRLTDLERQAKEAGERIEEAARHGIEELAQAYRRFRASLSEDEKGDKPAS